MAVAYQSTQVSGSFTQTAGTRTVTKPTSLAVGDLMIAYAVVDSTSTPSLPSGFTAISTVGSLSGVMTGRVGFKIATSSDVAATDFSFGDTGYASISRITGSSDASGSVVVAGAVQSNSATFSQSGLTPRDYGASTLFMMFLSVENGSGANITNYAIATSNPTWTEIYETSNGGETQGAAAAYAIRPEVTATGNFSASGGGSAGADWVGQLISIPVPYTSTTAESVTLSEASIEDIGATYAESLAVTETADSDVNRMRNQDKNSETATKNVTNLEKHE